jgi:hypothetical protein
MNDSKKQSQSMCFQKRVGRRLAALATVALLVGPQGAKASLLYDYTMTLDQGFLGTQVVSGHFALDTSLPASGTATATASSFYVTSYNLDAFDPADPFWLTQGLTVRYWNLQNYLTPTTNILTYSLADPWNTLDNSFTIDSSGNIVSVQFQVDLTLGSDFIVGMNSTNAALNNYTGTLQPYMNLVGGLLNIYNPSIPSNTPLDAWNTLGLTGVAFTPQFASQPPTPGPQVVPEPNVLGLLAVGGGLLWLNRRTRQASR